jgi:hypothetical protein
MTERDELALQVATGQLDLGDAVEQIHEAGIPPGQTGDVLAEADVIEAQGRIDAALGKE